MIVLALLTVTDYAVSNHSSSLEAMRISSQRPVLSCNLVVVYLCQALRYTDHRHYPGSTLQVLPPCQHTIRRLIVRWYTNACLTRIPSHSKTRSSFTGEFDIRVGLAKLPCLLLAVTLCFCYKLIPGFSCPSLFMKAHRASLCWLIDLLLLYRHSAYHAV